MKASDNPFSDPEQVVRALIQQNTICSDSVANAIFAIGNLKMCSKDEVFARQGDLGAELYYILSGSVRIVVRGHEYKIRSRGDLIGEMAVIEPGERRSADLIAAEDATMLWVVRASDFLNSAKRHGEIWECVARELASRLRQRDQFFVPPNENPVIFVGSSTEGVDILNKAVSALASPDRELRP
jgi:signal-transduction protein with cAMP-binding, CBS, and nucleotidyltransferase domain